MSVDRFTAKRLLDTVNTDEVQSFAVLMGDGNPKLIAKNMAVVCDTAARRVTAKRPATHAPSSVVRAMGDFFAAIGAEILALAAEREEAERRASNDVESANG